tara:strand:- start:4529 stop:5488 length:960 start_codon:yes stop_codon:yes gene_type:complete
MLININITENIIKNYYKILHDINQIKIDYKFDILKLTKETIKQQIDNNIVGKYVIMNLKSKILDLTYRYKVTFDNNVIIIFTDYPLKDSIKLKSLIKIIIYLQSIGNKKELISFFYMTNLKRVLSNNYFDTTAINGGYTQLGNNRKMIVWRKEDGIKVFIHELIHYFDIDISFRNFKDINNYHQITTNIDNIFEAFTDFYALNYYMVYLSLINNNLTKEFLHKNFIEQYNFSLHQGFKVIKYSGLSEGKLIKNTTNVYCYYLLKLYIMIYLRNKNLNRIKIKDIVINSYKLYTNIIFKKYIKKIILDNKLYMAYKQEYL